MSRCFLSQTKRYKLSETCKTIKRMSETSKRYGDEVHRIRGEPNEHQSNAVSCHDIASLKHEHDDYELRRSATSQRLKRGKSWNKW